MKKWIKVIIVIFAILSVVFLAASCAYRFYAKNKIENVLETAQEFLTDEKVEAEIQKFVDELIENGDINLTDIEGYTAYKNAIAEKQLAGTETGDSSQDDNSINTNDKKTSDSGNKNERVKSSPETQKAENNKTVTNGQKSDGGYSKKTYFDNKWQGPNLPDGYVPKESADVNNDSQTSGGNETLMDRVKRNMSADEFAFAMSVYSRLDTGYIMSNMNTDRAAVKAYVKSVLSAGEISRCLEIYGKYSYLLQ